MSIYKQNYETYLSISNVMVKKILNFLQEKYPDMRFDVEKLPINNSLKTYINIRGSIANKTWPGPEIHVGYTGVYIDPHMFKDIIEICEPWGYDFFNHFMSKYDLKELIELFSNELDFIVDIF